MFAKLCIKALKGKKKEEKESIYVTEYIEVPLVRFVSEF